MSDKSEEQFHVEKATCTKTGFIFFIAALASGTLSALTCKIAYETPSTGMVAEEGEKLFAKPIMMLLLMFFGMIPAIFVWLSLPPEHRGKITTESMILLAIPSLCDLLCTLLLLIAQLYLTASLWQMMRGSIIVMTAFVKRFGLSHRLRNSMWAGISVLTVALLLVAASTLYQTPAAGAPANTVNSDPKLGIGLVVLGCLAQAVQYVFEEKLMRVDDVPPLLVIVCEGCWGALLTLVVIYPVAYMIPGKDHGSYESPFDAMAMIYNSRFLQVSNVPRFMSQMFLYFPLLVFHLFFVLDCNCVFCFVSYSL
jgi:drug/metabolite transporter (DMT)-like permease